MIINSQFTYQELSLNKLNTSLPSHSLKYKHTSSICWDDSFSNQIVMNCLNQFRFLQNQISNCFKSWFNSNQDIILYENNGQRLRSIYLFSSEDAQKEINKIVIEKWIHALNTSPKYIAQINSFTGDENLFGCFLKCPIINPFHKVLEV